MNRYLAGFLLVVGVLCAAPVSATDAQSQEHSIIIGTELAYPPYSFLDEDGQAVGFNVDLTKAIAEVMNEDMGVRPTQLTENRKNRLAKLFRILTCQMCRSDTHALPIIFWGRPCAR